MGLDMYLTKRTYIGNKYKKAGQLVKVTIPKQTDKMFPIGNIENERIKEITEDVGYWRKANAIHKWFVDNVQGGEDECKESYVDEKRLKELLNIVNKVLKASILVKGKIQNGSRFENGKNVPIMVDGKKIKDPSVAKKLLPTTDGFFFGGTGYDEYYYDDLKETKKILQQALKEKGDFYYRASW